MVKNKDDIISHFKSPAGMALIINVVILGGNMIFASQLFPLTNTINLLAQRLETVEKRLDAYDRVIIPKGELDQRFTNIDNQLITIQHSLESARLAQ